MDDRPDPLTDTPSPRPAIVRAVPFIGCAAVLGILAALIIQTAGRALLVLMGIGFAFLIVLAFLHARQRGVAVRRFRERYGGEGKDLLLVYTASPHWQDYIEREWLPRWGARAVVLNRSQPWDGNSAEALLWFAYRTGREHTPLAVVVPRRGRARVVRFFKAFRDNKHGKPAALQARERELEAALEASSRESKTK